MDFNPRSPRGERRRRGGNLQSLLIISIHAPREGSDDDRQITWDDLSDFNPRSPRGERRGPESGIVQRGRFQSTLPARGATPARPSWRLRSTFQSTLPARGATASPWNSLEIPHISIHAPREGSDSGINTFIWFVCHFNPRSPRGERHHLPGVLTILKPISIHAPREGSDDRF